MMFDVKPIPAFSYQSSKDIQDAKLWEAITTAIHSCGLSGEDVTIKGIEVLRKMGREDLLCPCLRNDVKKEAGEI